MPGIAISDIQKFREITGVGMMDAKRALEASDGNFEAAITNLRKTGKKVAASKASRETREGVVGVYEHMNKKLVTAVAVACETDFVALTAEFQAFAHDLAMHIAAMNPTYLTIEDIPEEVLKKESEIARSQAAGKPENIVENIIKGKIAKFAAEQCLLEQTYFKDDTKTVRQVLEEIIQKLGENIQIRAFTRLTV